MTRTHATLGEASNGLVTCAVYEDGDVVVCHGTWGNCVSMAGVSGHGPLLNVAERLDLPFEMEQAVIEFVHDHADVYE